jgi:hypothetical protein
MVMIQYDGLTVPAQPILEHDLTLEDGENRSSLGSSEGQSPVGRDRLKAWVFAIPEGKLQAPVNRPGQKAAEGTQADPGVFHVDG